MKSSGECMINNMALNPLRGGYRVIGVTLGSYQVRGARGHELNIKQQE